MSLDFREARATFGLAAGLSDGPARAYAAFGEIQGIGATADGATEAETLAQLHITEIDLTDDATRIELSEDSMTACHSTMLPDRSPFLGGTK